MATWIWRITERGRQLKILIEKVDFFSKCFYGILKYLYHFTHCTCVICIRLDFLQLSWTVICLSMWNLFVVSTRVSLPSNITNIIYIFTWFTPVVVICHTAWWYKLSTVISMMPRFLRISQYQISNREETFILYYWSNNRQDIFSSKYSSHQHFWIIFQQYLIYLFIRDHLITMKRSKLFMFCLHYIQNSRILR